MEKDSVTNNFQLLAIGGSAGSLKVLLRVLPAIRADIHFAIIIVLHRKNTGDTLLTDILSAKTKLVVKEPDEKETIQPGVIYVAPADYHLLIESDRSFSFDGSEKVNHSRPSIDITFESAAYIYGSSLACMLLSGANSDGTLGMKVAHQQHALIVIQSPQSAEMPVMPNAALQSLPIDKVLLPEHIADFINNLP